MAVESYAATSLAKVMGHSILDSLGHEPRSSPTYDAIDSRCVASSILGLANDIQTILGDALAEATTMFPYKPPATLDKGTLLRHLWPKSVRHDVSSIQRRAKAVRRLVKHETKTPVCTQDESLAADPSLPLWSSVNTPLSLFTFLYPPPKDLDTLGVLLRPDPTPTGTTTLQAAHGCFRGLRKAAHLLIRYVRNLRRRKYGKSLVRMIVNKPSVALKSILRTSEGTPDNPTLPTDLSVLRDETFGFLTTPSEVITQLEKMETTALPPYPALPPGAPFPWLGYVRPAPTSSVPMLIGQITPAIFHEALRRTLNYKAEGPNEVPGLVLKHISPTFHETIHLLFQALAITWITLPS